MLTVRILGRCLRSSSLLTSTDASYSFTPGTTASWGTSITTVLPPLAHAEPTTPLRKHYHKSLSLALKKRRFSQFDRLVQAMSASAVEFDEVTMTLIFFAALLAPSGGVTLAQQVLADFRTSPVMHPSLLYFHENFLKSLAELGQFDAYPNEANLRKCLKPCWEVARQFKMMRLAMDPHRTIAATSKEARACTVAAAGAKKKYVERRVEFSRMEKMAKSLRWMGKMGAPK
jgi:hypothetical protein